MADGDPPRTDSDSAMPSASKAGAKDASANSPARLQTSTRAGRRPTAAETRSQPRPLGCSLPYVGRNGQNAARPSRTRVAGRKVSAASTARAMLTAEIGPRPRLEPRSEKSRQSTPRITVAPEATIGSHDCRSACRIATCFDGSVRSSSR